MLRRINKQVSQGFDKIWTSCFRASVTNFGRLFSHSEYKMLERGRVGCAQADLCETRSKNLSYAHVRVAPHQVFNDAEHTEEAPRPRGWIRSACTSANTALTHVCTRVCDYSLKHNTHVARTRATPLVSRNPCLGSLFATRPTPLRKGNRILN